MRYLLTIGLLSLVGLTSTAQSVEPDASELRHAIGLNATGLIDNLLSEENGDNGLPYLITYEFSLGKLFLRAGLGPEYFTETIVHEGFADSQKRTDLQLDARIGAGIRMVDTDRWDVSTGIDIIGKYDLEEVTDDSGFDRITDEVESQSIGAGPFIQLSYRLSPRVSIRTEGALYIRRYETTHTELFENFPDFNNQLSKTTGTALDTHVPASIFIHFYF